jgi:O-antigen/teichoic acid export membrane protein
VTLREVTKRIGLLLGPLLGIALVALALYGAEGPSDNPRVNAAAQVIGFIYGIFAITMVIRWVSQARRRE